MFELAGRVMPPVNSLLLTDVMVLGTSNVYLYQFTTVKCCTRAALAAARTACNIFADDLFRDAADAVRRCRRYAVLMSCSS